MHQILASALEAALSAIGFIVRRWIRKDRISEIIERRLKLVALYQKMIAAGLNVGDLDRLERHLAEGAPRRDNGASDPSNAGPGPANPR